MKPPDDALLSLVRQWIGKAEVDYQTAKRLLRDEEPIRESIGFHCQQAVEKYLKAFLVAHQVEFPKTHSIARLLDQVAGVAPALATALEDTIALTPFGVQSRYPGDFAELLPGQEQIVFELAGKARHTIRKQLAQDPAGR